MSALASLIFGSPLALAALLALPAIWWLLRLTPPRPRRVVFPPTALLADLDPADRTPAHTPWWLTLLRLTLAALLIAALARPEWRPDPEPALGSGPLWLIVDDGWPAAAGWEEQRRAAERILADAARTGRPTTLVGTVEGAAQDFDPQPPEDAARRLAVLGPRALPDDRPALLAGLAAAAARAQPGAVVWLTHGADLDPAGSSAGFAEGLARLTPDAVRRLSRPARLDTVAIADLEPSTDALALRLVRAATESAATVALRALDRRGRVLAEVAAPFAPGSTAATARFALPRAVLDEIARVEVVEPTGAGGVRLLDESSRRRTVGLIGGSGSDRAQPLLTPEHYLEAALIPFADLRRPRAGELAPAVTELLEPGLSVLIAADLGGLTGEVAARIEAWVKRGGVLVRFAGPRLAAARGPDPLLPVALRQGERSFGGALSWSEPHGLGPFAATGPFAGLAVPGDVRVARQILAEPGPELAERTWASLDDGTPLVTAQRLGEGRVVLFHVGADTSWSNLALSGTFVEMLRRITALAVGGASTSSGAALPPWRLLDGAGQLGAPSAEARPLERTGGALPKPDRSHPPGLYGDDLAFVSLPTFRLGDRLAPLDAVAGFTATVRRADESRDLAPALLVAALLLALLDAAIALAPRLHRPRRAPVHGLVALFLAAALLATPDRAQAADADAFARAAATSTRLAYVVTGDSETDDVARRGLVALSRALGERTALEPGEPVGVDPARDELAFFPILYWPIAPGVAIPDARVLGRVDAYMKNGGLVVFDTRDAVDGAAPGRARATPAGEALRALLSRLDLPELEPLPVDHVLGRTFFLLRDLPGRFDGGRPWVEASGGVEGDGAPRPLRAGDGVSSILITGADWIGAWAEDDGGDPLLPVQSADPKAREMAMRVGINIVMYAITGNYKADQVHVPTLLQRLGR
ncbi:DUF4159 domain-containing protein [Siculibacillus lacustris]|uniref:DUF4159 domain-containing protein n=1 Tax=Siculibacillus lacustris TaxID=1549641 RepID=A0A4Q9VP13_9HYPH|nr:DUF4159 domain-containing protein [Siculibacillus lacustris]TBW37425.1 DUF4159 domain-containing protein [Siculibacillus lacustris]